MSSGVEMDELAVRPSLSRRLPRFFDERNALPLVATSFVRQ
jgi:hypothetical protein